MALAAGSAAGGGFEIVELGGGLHTLRDRATGETFHPRVGPMAEAEAIHIAPLDLENRAAGETFTVWDVGFGAAANAIAFLEKARRLERPFHGELISFDLTLEPVLFALENAEKLGYPLPWREALQALLENGRERVCFPNGGWVEWRLVLGDFSRLPEAPAPDGIIYDPYSPRKNLAMWSLEHFTKLRERLAPPAILTSYSRSTAVRVTLLLAGFYVGIGSPTGEKDETTLAATHLDLLKNPLGASWLQRVRLSTSSQPLGLAVPGPIDPATLARLEEHPQFRPTPQADLRAGFPPPFAP